MTMIDPIYQIARMEQEYLADKKILLALKNAVDEHSTRAQGYLDLWHNKAIEVKALRKRIWWLRTKTWIGKVLNTNSYLKLNGDNNGSNG